MRKVLHQLVLERSRTVERFAHEHGIEQSILSKFFSGRSSISLGTFLRIVSALDLDIGPTFSLARVNQVGSGKSPLYDPRPIRRNRVSVVLTETRTLEIRRTEEDDNPLVLKFS